MAFEPTKEQKTAIYEKGSIIVSAAAGSGKTAVLVERVANLLTDKDDPLEADKLLIVTFTNAAAAELRVRIEKRMNEEFETHPDDVFYQKQRILLNGAKIATIDSFCIDFLKDNFEHCGLNPAFKMCDNATLSNLENMAMTSLVNECFCEQGDDFGALLDFLGETYDDSTVKTCIKKIFDFSRKMPFPDLWLDKIVREYEECAAGKENKWFSGALKAVEAKADDALFFFRQAFSVIENDAEVYERRSENYAYFCSFCEELIEKCRSGEWNEVKAFAACMKAPSMKRLPNGYKSAVADKGKELKEKGSKVLKSVSDILYADKAEICAETEGILFFIKQLVSLVKRYEAKLYEMLRQQDMMTFYMSEQAVLSMLAEEINGEIVRRADADVFISRYKAILVDEYQDTNSLQDTLFHILSDGGKNLFCVGDMKQSIYRFRGSNPLNFLKKKESAKHIDDRTDSDTLRVDLGSNFRSRAEICDFINSIFEKALFKENSDFDYDENEKLVPKAVYPENNEQKVELHNIDYDALNADTDEEIDKRILAEAEIIADIVTATVSKPAFLRDVTGLRTAGFGDITILVRSMSTSGLPIIKTLKDRGIPVSASSGDVAASDEVQTLLALLKIINNPFDDIALVTVMTSPAFAFTVNEVAQIRSCRRYGNFISAVTFAAKEGNLKAKSFLDTVAFLRRKSVMLPIAQLIDEIFEETALLSIVSSAEYGEIKRLNLLCVQNFARSFEKDSRKDLRSFINYFDSLDDRDFSLVSDSFNSVTVTTIHKSKGLQYPVCILADAVKRYNQKDLGGKLLLSEEYGLSLKYCDAEGGMHDNFVLRSAMKEEERRLLFAEELRLLYVALTRAEEKLIVVSSYKKYKDEMARLADSIQYSGSKARLSHGLFRRSDSYASIIAASLMMDGRLQALIGEADDPQIIIHKVLPKRSELEQDRATLQSDPEKVRKLKDIYSTTYPYAPLLDLQSKASVTEIVHKADDKLYRFTRRPAFVQEKGLSSAEKGTAIHKVMQYGDFARCKSDLKGEVERLYEYMYLSEAEYNVIDFEKLETFFSSRLFDRIQSAPLVKREMKFLTEFPASFIRPDLDDRFADETIVVQGAVDLLFREEDKLIIVDFKTDRNKDENALLEAYSEQLKIYAMACSKLLKLPVSQLLIYSFSLGKEIEVK